MAVVLCRRPTTYRRYDTHTKIWLHSNHDPALIRILQIPPSTISSWRNTDFSALCGLPKNLSIPKKFLAFQRLSRDAYTQKLLISFYKISDTLKNIFTSCRGFKKAFEDKKELILKTIDTVKDALDLKTTLRLFGLSFYKYYSWLNEKICGLSSFGKCLKRYPGQVSMKEVRKMKFLLKNPLFSNWPFVSIWMKGIRSGLISCGRTTFYNYARKLGFSKPIPKHRRKNHSIGLRANAPNQYWHADVTIFRPLDNTKVYIYLIIDNYSRLILSWRASLELSAKIRMETLIEAYKQYLKLAPKDPVRLIVDGGPENNILPFLTPEIAIQRLIAQKDIIFSNSMIEAFNKILKYWWLFRKDLLNFNSVVDHLDKIIPEYNNLRPHGQLAGLTPLESFLGKFPQDVFKNLPIKEILSQRIKENSLNLCEDC